MKTFRPNLIVAASALLLSIATSFVVPSFEPDWFVRFRAAWYNSANMQAPLHNWALFEEKCRPEHIAWLRALTPEQAVSLCEELRSLAGELTSDGSIDEQVSWKRWEDKLAIRRKLLAAFMAHDRRRSER